MVYTKIDTVKEERDYRAEVEEVKRWWTQPRFRKIKRYQPHFLFSKQKLMCDVGRILRRVWFQRGGPLKLSMRQTHRPRNCLHFWRNMQR